jgi:lipopolysaccharide/colanic/teichoic acid biosynthesis glycosyltransferase
LGEFVTERALLAGETAVNTGITHPEPSVAELVRALNAGPAIAHRTRPTQGQHQSVARGINSNESPTDSEQLQLVDLTEAPVIDLTESTEQLLARRLRSAEFVVLPNAEWGYHAAKRVIDVIGALILLMVSAPILAVLTIIIRTDSPGPALFRQTRVTKNGKHFTFYKFRTMYSDARIRFPGYYDFGDVGDTSRAFYKVEDDPRNTKVGRWLRRTTLDELPNLLNVLRGDISLVGPRPDLPELIPHYTDIELCCLLTKAGLTGAAQTKGRSLLTVKERLRLDVNYVSHQSTWLDIRLLARTILVVVLGRGAF